MTDTLNDDRVELLRVRDVAIRYGIIVNTVWIWTCKGIIPKPKKFCESAKWSLRQIAHQNMREMLGNACSKNKCN